MTATASRIAVAASKPIAQRLRSLGFDVIDDTQASFEQFRSALSSGEAFRAVLVESSPQMMRFIPDLVDDAQRGGVPATVVHVQGGPDTTYAPGATDLRPPYVFNDLLRALGYQDMGEAGEDQLVVVPPALVPLAAPEPMPLPAAEPEPAPLPIPAPAPAPVPAPAPLPAAAIPTELRQTPQQAPGPVADRYQTETATAVADPLDDLFDTLQPVAKPSKKSRTPGSLAEVVIVLAGKGGVSKTTTSYSIATRAAESGLGRVLIIDGNRGQGGIRVLLGIKDSAPLPTIHDLKYSDVSVRDIILSPDQLNEHRPDRAHVRVFAVLAPPVGMGNSRETPADFYSKVIAEAREHFDLVVIDTQTLDDESSDLFEEAFIPAMRAGAWGLSLTDKSNESLKGLAYTFKKATTSGVRPSRMMWAATLYGPGEFDANMAAQYSNHFAKYASFVGSTVRDKDFASQLEVGVVDVDSPAVRPMLDEVLLTVTGLDMFQPKPEEPQKRRRFSLFGGRK